MTTMQDMKPGQHWIGVTEGMRGWFACEFWLNNRDIEDTVFPEPWQSDPNSFATKEEAIEWAKELAEMDDLLFIE